MTAIDFDARYRVKNWPAVAVYIDSYPQIWEPCLALCIDEETGEEWEEETCEGEWIDDTECGDVMVVMVGDDRKHRVSVSDLIKIDDLDYCSVCGQIGCGHDGRDRDDD